MAESFLVDLVDNISSSLIVVSLVRVVNCILLTIWSSLFVKEAKSSNSNYGKG